MSYQDNVRAAAAALTQGEKANWDLARLTFISTLMAGEKPGQSHRVPMEQWCTDVRASSGRRFSRSTGERYKAIWYKFGPSLARDPISWTDAYEAMQGTPGKREANTDITSALARATPEEKREVFERIVREEPAVVQEAWQDTATNVALSEARWKARDEMLEPQREAQRETAPIFEPRDTALDRRNLLASIATRVDQWTRELNGIRDILEASDDVDFGRRWATRQALERLVKAAIACRDTLPSEAVARTPEPGHHQAGRQRRLA